MRKNVLAALIMTGILLGTASCGYRISDETSASDVSVRETLIEPSGLTTPESYAEPTKESSVATPTHTPAPSFTFDWTEEAVAAPVKPLMFIGAMDQSVVVGGEVSPLVIDATYISQYTDTVWSDENISYGQCQYSINRSSVVTSDTIYENEGEFHSLSYCDGIEVHVISTEELNGYVLSLSGNAVVYMEVDDTTYDLCLYDTSTGQNRIIDEDVEKYAGYLCVSPSGDAVSYKDESGTVHLFVGDEERKINMPEDPIAISNGGKLIYSETWDYESHGYYVNDGNKTVTLSEIATDLMVTHSCELLFNQDLTQVLVAVDQKLWLSKDGSNPVSIVSLPDPDESIPFWDQSWGITCLSTQDQLIGYRFDKISLLPVRNLADQLYRFSDTIFFLDRNMQVHNIAESTSEPGTEASVAGNSIAYLQKSPEYEGFDVYYMADYRGTESGVKIPVEYAVKVILTKDQSLYIENDIGQIYLVRGSSAPVLIDIYAHLAGQFEVDGPTYVYYTKNAYDLKMEHVSIEYGNTLYRLTDGSAISPLPIATDIYVVFIDVTGVYTAVESSLNATASDYEWYETILYSKDGINFDFLCTTRVSE